MAADAVVQVLKLIGHADWKTAVVLLLTSLLALVWPWLRAHVRASSVLVWDQKLRGTCIPAEKRRSQVDHRPQRSTHDTGGLRRRGSMSTDTSSGTEPLIILLNLPRARTTDAVVNTRC